MPDPALNDRSRPRPRLLAACAALLACLAGAAIVAGGASRPETATAQGADARPNIIFLFTDDQEPSSMRVMRHARRELKRKGVSLRRFYTQFPLCCPSRATMLTGQYSHNHQVISNSPPDGGYGVFNELHGDNYLPLWLQSAGYTTSYIGKYLNQYAEPDEYGTTPLEVPRGWDDWQVLAPSKARYFNYQMNQNGKLRDYRERDQDYSTDVFTRKARRFIRQNGPDSSPYFLMLGYAAPHGGGGRPGSACNRAAVPAPRHLRGLTRKQRRALDRLPRSYNEADVSDKPSPIANNPPITKRQQRDIKRRRRCAWESLLSVDESIDALVKQVKRSGELRNTYIFFTSDNGFLRGEHRIRNQKRYLYEESARVPFFARGPGIARNETSDDVVTNADVVPTFLELSGATPGLTQDGQSLMPSFAEPQRQHGRAIQLEAFAVGPQVVGLRTSRYLYAEWETEGAPPELELYNTDADPRQMENLAHDPAYAPVVANMAAQLAELRDCVGEGCRGAPTGAVDFATGGNGKRNCARAPVVARFDGSNAAQIASLTFEVEGKRIGRVTEQPYERKVPYKRVRRLAPKPATVVATALYEDGRRLAIPANVRACR